MSLSKEKHTGTIFMGPDSDRETTLEKLYEHSTKDTWNERTEAEYMERVRAKATERVRSLLVRARERGTEIINEAHKDADGIRAEAEHILADANHTLEESRAVRAEAQTQRDMGHQEGYAQGHAEVMAQLAEARREMGETIGAVLLGIHEQCGSIFEAWRGQLTELFKEAVEKSTGIIVGTERRAMLEHLLEQSMRALLDRSQYTVKVNPADAELLMEMLADAHQSSPRTANWEMATDPALEPGSLVVESSLALIDNSRQARQAVVDEVLSNLSIPFGQADQNAFNAVTTNLVGGLRKNGITFESGAEHTEAAQDHADFSAAPEMADTSTAAPAFESPEFSGAPEGGFPLPPDLHDDASNMDFQVPGSDGYAGSDGYDGMPEPDMAMAQNLPDAAEGQMSPPAMEAQPEFIPEPAPEAAPDFAPDMPEPLANAFPEPVPEQVMEQAAQPDHAGLAEAEALDMVDEFLSEPEPAATPAFSPEPAQDEENPGLPPDLADELLADMGFGGDTAAP